MNKIPVIATALNAWRFTFANYRRLLGVTWFSVVIMAIGSVVIFPHLIAALHPSGAAVPPATAFAALGWVYLFEIAMLLVFCVVALGVCRLALGLPVKWPYFYFSVDGALWRYFGLSFVVIVLSFIAAVIAIVAVTFLLYALLGAPPDPNVDPSGAVEAQQDLLMVVMPVMYGLIGFLLVRFGSLLAPIALQEDRFGPIRNWELTRGNSWRILAVYFVAALPWFVLGIVQVIATSYWSGSSFPGTVAGASQQEQLAASEAILSFYARYAYIVLPLSILISPLSCGTFFSVPALCYRVIVPESPEDQSFA